jgi:phosphoribosylanthranilate isomerase
MKVIPVSTRDDAARALLYRDVSDMVMFDAKAPKGAVLPGGNGIAFDWSALDEVRDKIGFMLSGGLTPDNVAEAIAATGARAVDVSSGVETAPGVKSPGLIRQFVRAAKSAP